MINIYKAIAALFALILAGCATPYQPAGANGGYSHQRLSNDRFVVTFEAPQVGFGEQRLRDLCLLRCAEVAKEHKFSHFTIEGNDHQISSEPIHTSGMSTTQGTSEVKADGKVKYEETTHSSTNIHTVQRTTISYEIRCYEEPPTSGNVGRIYDAQATIEDMRYKHGLI